MKKYESERLVIGGGHYQKKLLDNRVGLMQGEISCCQGAA